MADFWRRKRKLLCLMAQFQCNNIVHETKYPYKRRHKVLQRLDDVPERLPQQRWTSVMGDINIIVAPPRLISAWGEPECETLCWNRWRSFQPEEREWLKTPMDWGFVTASVYYILKWTINTVVWLPLKRFRGQPRPTNWRSTGEFKLADKCTSQYQCMKLRIENHHRSDLVDV